MTNSNGDTNRVWKVEYSDSKDNPHCEAVRGIGSFHKTLPHNKYGEVDPAAFAALVSATRGDGREFAQVPLGDPRQTIKIGFNDNGKLEEKAGCELAAQFTNPQAGLARDRLTHEPAAYSMPPAPSVTSNTTAAEMVELYWMALLRDVNVCDFEKSDDVDAAVQDINDCFKHAINCSFVTGEMKYEKEVHPNSDGPDDRFILGTDVPGSSVAFTEFKSENLFRLGFPGDDIGPMISQFFLRPVPFGTQTIDQRQRPYKKNLNYLTQFEDWLKAQNSGKDGAGQSYGQSNEDYHSVATPDGRYEPEERYIATMRDLARFVNKDALHQAYFNAALVLLSGGAKWPLGNP